MQLQNWVREGVPLPCLRITAFFIMNQAIPIFDMIKYFNMWIQTVPFVDVCTINSIHSIAKGKECVYAAWINVWLNSVVRGRVNHKNRAIVLLSTNEEDIQAGKSHNVVSISTAVKWTEGALRTTTNWKENPIFAIIVNISKACIIVSLLHHEINVT